MIKTPITLTLTDTYQAVDLGTEDAFGFAVTAVDSGGDLVSFKYAVDGTGTGEAVTPNIGKSWPHYEKPGATVLYAKKNTIAATLVLDPGTWVKN